MTSQNPKSESVVNLAELNETIEISNEVFIKGIGACYPDKELVRLGNDLSSVESALNPEDNKVYRLVGKGLLPDYVLVFATDGNIIEAPNDVWRSALPKEVELGVASPDLFSGIEAIASKLISDQTLVRPFSNYFISPIKKAFESKPTTTLGLIERLVKINELDDAVSRDVERAKNEVFNLVNGVRDASLRGKDLDVVPSELAYLRKHLESIVARFHLEGHSGSTYRLGAEHIIKAVRTVARRVQEQCQVESLENPSALYTGVIKFEDLVAEELAPYGGIEGMWEQRDSGNFAFLPVFDMRRYPTQLDDGSFSETSIPLEFADTLINSLTQLLLGETLVYPLDLDDESNWQDLGYTKQCNKLPYLFKDKDGSVSAGSRIIFVNTKDDKLTMEDLSGCFTTRQSSIVLTVELGVAHSRHDFKGFDPILVPCQNSETINPITIPPLSDLVIGDYFISHHSSLLRVINIVTETGNESLVLENHKTKEITTVTDSELRKVSEMAHISYRHYNYLTGGVQGM